jgi:hypothetical protein
MPKGWVPLANAFKAEASDISITGNAVVNPGIANMNTVIATKYAFSFSQINPIRLFDNLDASQRSTLLSMSKLRESELPLIWSVQDLDNGFLLTTERLVWPIGGERQELPADIVRDATVHLKRFWHTSKLEMRQLQVATMGSSEYLMHRCGIWNVLKNLGGRYRSVIETAG